MTPSSTTIFCTAMSSNAEFEALAREMLALSQTSAPDADSPRKADGPGRGGVLVARLLPDFNLERWRHFCRDHAKGRWYVWPAGPDTPPDLAHMDACGGSPPADDALLAGLLLEQIRREMLRGARSGSELSLICAALPQRDVMAPQHGPNMTALMDAALAASLREHSEACDSLGHLACGSYALLLPGVGALRARLLSSAIQKTFLQQAMLRCGKPDTAPPACALGIACADSGAAITAEALLAKARSALQDALLQTQQQNSGRICLADSTSLEERASLVHSSEKRFLFFGRNN